MAKHAGKAGRRWVLESARAILPDIRERTARAVGEVERFEAERAHLREGEELAEVEERIQGEFSRWVREMEALGVEVRGVWLVDFDTGSGCFCWKWPEREVEWFHGYEEGFGGRVRIQ